MNSKAKFSPLVSVIINSHNGKNFIKKSVKSVLSQSYRKFEIIFFDNYSNDNSFKEIKKFKNKKIKYFYSKKFLKLYHARDLAVKKAKGKLIAFLDVDDWWEVEKLKKQVKVFNNPSVVLSFTNYKIHNEKNNTIKKAFKFLPNGIITNDLLKKNFIGMCTLMFRKSSYFKLIKGFDHNYEIIGDYDLCLRLSENQIVKSINNCLSNYRWHSSNLSNTKRELNFLELIKWYKKNNTFKKYTNFQYLVNFSYYQLGLSYVLNNKKILASKLIKKLSFYYKLKLIILILIPSKLTKILKYKTIL